MLFIKALTKKIIIIASHSAENGGQVHLKPGFLHLCSIFCLLGYSLPPHLVDGVHDGGGLDRGHDLLPLPHPVEEDPVRPSGLGHKVLAVGGEAHGHELGDGDVSGRQHLPLAALLVLQVVHGDHGPVPALRHGQVTLIGTDGQRVHATRLLQTYRGKMNGRGKMI